jgi:antitoxin CcdA
LAGNSPACEVPGPSIAVREEQREQWLIDNRTALEVYNQHVESDGVFSDRLRLF